MLLKDLLNVIVEDEFVGVFDEDNYQLGWFHKGDDKESLENMIEKYGEFEVKNVETNKDTEDDTNGEIIIHLNGKSKYQYDLLLKNCFRYKGNVYQFFYLQEEDRAVLFKKGNDDEPDELINWFYTGFDDYLEVTKTVEKCIDYIMYNEKEDK